MILVKIGGALLTDKSRYRAARFDAIARAAYEITLAREPVVLVHGAGSFGHVLAKEHRLAEGVATAEARAAFARVHADVVDLDGLLVSALQEAGARPLAFPPLALALLENGALARFDADPIRRALDAGFLPVTHGDGVLDRARGAGILSGDEIMVALARDLKPRLAVFATDVDGIFQGAPGEPGSALLTQVRARDLEAMTLGGAKGADVTGGMAGKARRILKLTDLGVPVRVLNGNAPGRLSATLQGEKPLSTEVVP